MTRDVKCAFSFCQGHTSDFYCSDHGDLCSECLLPTVSGFRDDNKCSQCGARADGITCADCGSPWIYLTFWKDGLWRCKPCVGTIIRENGYEETEEAVKQRFEGQLEAAKREQEEREAQVRIELENAKAKRIARAERKEAKGDNLFTLGETKRKKKQ